MLRWGLLVSTAAVLAACISLPRYEAAFAAIDTNRDAVIEWREFKTYYPEADPKSFLEADDDKNGDISAEEWQRFLSIQGS
jgi:hypothetical protein